MQMYENRKNLVRCNASVEKKVQIDGKQVWADNGFVEFETKLDISFILQADEELLNEVFSEMVKKHNTSDLRYEFIDFELIYHFPIKLKGNPIKQYNIMFKQFTNYIKNKIYE